MRGRSGIRLFVRRKGRGCFGGARPPHTALSGLQVTDGAAHTLSRNLRKWTLEVAQGNRKQAQRVCLHFHTSSRAILGESLTKTLRVLSPVPPSCPSTLDLHPNPSSPNSQPSTPNPKHQQKSPAGALGVPSTTIKKEKWDATPYVAPPHFLYRGTSRMKKLRPLGPYSRTLPRAIWWY